MVKFLPGVEALLQFAHDAAVVHSFDLMWYLAEHVRGELEVKHGCGFGDSEEPYAFADARMTRVIVRRLQQTHSAEHMAWVKETVKSEGREGSYRQIRPSAC
jgi:hypothetical protein